MIYRLRYCNKDGVEARVDIQKGSSTPVIGVEGTERPFILSYNNDKGDKSGMFLSSSADIEIYETADFNIDNLKTSNETELSVTHYINNVVSWQGFIIPDFFSIEVRNNPVITMTASDRLGTLKNITLADLPTMVNLRELAILCLNKTGLTLPLRTMADFNNGTGINDFFNSKILTQRLSDTKGRSISCYDILSSILTASNSFLVQRAGAWHIINKIQHEAGSGKLYTGATSFINWSDVIFNFSDINVGGRRTIIPVASTVGVFHEFGGGKLHPDNYDFAQGTAGWVASGGYSMNIEDREVKGYSKSGSNWITDFGQTTTKKRLKVQNFLNFPLTNLDSAPYAKATFPLITTNTSSVDISMDMSVVGMPWYRTGVVVLAEKGETILAFSQSSGRFEPYDPRLATNPGYPDFMINLSLPVQGSAEDKSYYDASTKSMKFSCKLEDSDLTGWNITIRLYGYYSLQLGSRVDFPMFFSFANVSFSNTNEIPKGNIYKTEKDGDFTKAHDIDTSIFADYITYGLNGFFYEYPIDDTSSLYNSANELTTKWTAYNDPEQLPLLQHITRQRSRLFSVAHDLLSAEIEVNNFDPLAIFVACEKRYTVVSAQFDFFKSNLSVELEEVAFQIANVRDFIYSYFGDGESGIKSIGGISGGGGGGGGGTGGGLTSEQLEILSFWKKDPDNPDTIFTEMNAYSTKELSAYGVGDGSSGGGSDYERLDTWASYDSTRAGWVLSAFLGNDLNTRVTAIDGRVTDLENSAGSGSVTSVGISVPTGLSVSNSPITSSGVIAIGLQDGYSIPTTVKQGQWDTAYSNNHTHSNKTVLDGITSALVSNWDTAYSNTHTHSNKTVLDGITSALISDWNTAFNNSHTHSNKTQLDLITQSNIDVLAKLSIVNGNLQIDGNAYATGELSAYGVGSGGGGGGGIIETVYGYSNLGQTFNNSILTDTFNAYTINQLHLRLQSVESGSATTVNTTGTGNAITSISKAGSVITANKDLTFLETSIFSTHNNDNVRHITGAERTKWDAVVADFDNLEIGGRNYISSKYRKLEIRENRYVTVPFEAGVSGQLTLSFNRNVIQGDAISSYLIFRNDVGATIITGFITGTGSTYFTFKVEELISEVSIYSSGNWATSEGIYMDIDDLQLEKGTKATDWSPAPEDQVSDWNTTDVNSFSFIKNKPTTLAGYGITDAYTKTEVDTALTSKLDKSVFDDLFEKVEVSTGVFAIKAKYNFYGVGEVSAYGVGSGGGTGGGGIIETVYGYGSLGQTFSNSILTDTFNAYTINQINTRLVDVESGSATNINVTGTGDVLTNVTKSGNNLNFTKGNQTWANLSGKPSTFAPSTHTHTIAQITDLQTALDGKQPLDTDLTSIAGLTGTSGLLRKTAANTWSLDTNTYLTGNQSISLTGDVTGSGTTSISTSIAASVVTGKALTGYTVGSNTALTATDTILSAFGKVQAQINARGGTVTSVAMTTPTGLTVTGSPITSSGTLALSLQSGYSIPTTAKINNWDEVRTWWQSVGQYLKRDVANSALYTDENFYSTKEVSAYGLGSSGGGGSGLIETVYNYNDLGQTFNNSTLTDTFNAYTINQINTRLASVESGSAITVNTTGTGNAITSISKDGSVITANKDLAFTETSIFNTHNNDNVRHITGAERTKWDGVVTDFDNLQIGGTNLIPKSRGTELGNYANGGLYAMGGYVLSIDGGDSFRIASPGVPDPPDNQNNIRIATGKTLQLNETYTLSFEAMTSSSQDRDHNVRMPYLGNNIVSIKTGDWQKYSVTFKITNEVTVDGSNNYFFFWQQNQGIYITYLRRVKLEKGTIPTDWSPAPEDQGSDWDTTDINSFSFIKNKPTTLSGYGITDAVTLNTAQTISGAKTFTASVTAPTFIGALNGNASTATTLATAITLTVGNTGKTFNGGANRTWSLTEIGAASLSQSVIAGNGLTGGGTLAADRTITLATPSTLTAATTNGVTASSHTHAITTTSVGDANTIVQTDATGAIQSPAFKLGNGWSLIAVGTETQLQYNGVTRLRLTNTGLFEITGDIVSTGEVTAYN